MSGLKRIAAFVPNLPGKSPGQRARIETWARHLPAFGWTVDFYPFEDQRLAEVLYERGHLASKAASTARCFVCQLGRALQRPPCDLIFIYREAALAGPEIIERVCRTLGKPIVYDIDDPIFLPANSTASGLFGRLKFAGKTDRVIALSDLTIAISSALADHARQNTDDVATIPNMLDPERYVPQAERKEGPVRLGWSGSHSTTYNLTSIAEPLRVVQQRYGAEFITIGAPTLDLPNVVAELRAWAADTEVAELQRFDIGLLPVAQHPGNRYKFFLKLIQYMAVGLPVVAQRAGANDQVIEDGVNGFLVDTPAEWAERLSQLIGDPELRQRMGSAARQTVLERYTPEVLMPRVAQLFDQTLGKFGSDPVS